MLGKITEAGLIPTKARRERAKTLQNDVVEFGATNYFYQRTKDIRQKLQEHFLNNWKYIYSISLLRAIYERRFRRLGTHYGDSILSCVYPDLNFAPYKITETLKEIGRRRNVIQKFMLSDMGGADRFILFDGHRLLSSASSMDNSELGYDSKRRYKPQINLVYLFTIGANTGIPYITSNLSAALRMSSRSKIFWPMPRLSAKTAPSLPTKASCRTTTSASSRNRA